MYKALITGATGFVGRNLMTYLGSVGYGVNTISKQEFMNEDFSGLDAFKPDIVVHCAWPKIDLHSTDHLEFAEMSCNFFNECKKRGVRVINLGSSSEYGAKDVPMKEDMICEPINTYGIAKLMVSLYAKKLGFNTLRLFTVVGKGGHSFFDIAKDWNILKWEYPESRRTRIPVIIVCKAVERLMHAEHLYGEIINVAGDKEETYGGDEGYIDCVDTQKKSKWMNAPQTQYEPRHWAADNKKMYELLNL